MNKATQDLRNEHDSILHVLNIIDRMIDSDLSQDKLAAVHTDLVYFLKTFADKCHHGKEENYLFKSMAAKGFSLESGPIGVMLSEHTQGREYIAQMSQSAESKDSQSFNQAAAAYRDLMRNHIDKENNVLFIMADNTFTAAEQDELFERFEQFEETVIGHGIHEQLHAMIHSWDEMFPAG
jgi:hemerythrin-like domain-containing protein